jgi:hypothetical protein
MIPPQCSMGFYITDDADVLPAGRVLLARFLGTLLRHDVSYLSALLITERSET